jgi:hypothetical protein
MQLAALRPLNHITVAGHRELVASGTALRIQAPVNSAPMTGSAVWRNSASHSLNRVGQMPIHAHPRINSQSRSLNLLPPRTTHQKYVRQAFSSSWLSLTSKRVANAGWFFICSKTPFTTNAMRYLLHECVERLFDLVMKVRRSSINDTRSFARAIEEK